MQVVAHREIRESPIISDLENTRNSSIWKASIYETRQSTKLRRLLLLLQISLSLSLPRRGKWWKSGRKAVWATQRKETLWSSKREGYGIYEGVREKKTVSKEREKGLLLSHQSTSIPLNCISPTPMYIPPTPSSSVSSLSLIWKQLFFFPLFSILSFQFRVEARLGA